MTVGGFRDQSQVERIRERLWSGREFGRAAVMIGAGFSRNAERGGTDVPVFPLWGGIAGAMYDALYPPGSLEDTARDADRKARIAGATRLASEYEMTFGRQALDDLLIGAIPDERYEPGPVHEKLLSLPWSDVFTTNYDTLLERTRAAVHGRKYDLVYAPSDVPAQSRPRIVKLHGSFPSHRPFVATEEDFRTYPIQSAAFVNLVQQSIMENAFCLLGFSGDDPNFLSWTGWVRDNLGPSTPPVYLVGLLQLSGSGRRLLEGRRVTPVDLSPLFLKSEWPDPLQRHARAAEWFLENLAEGRPPSIERWPVPSLPEPRERGEGLPAVPEGPRPIPDPGPRTPRPLLAATTEELRELREKWEGTRRSYPGWQIAPDRNRKPLWDRTEQWIHPVLDSAEGLGVPHGLFLLRELNWRLERCLVPLFPDWASRVGPVVEAYNPFPGLVDLPDAAVRVDAAQYRGLDWEKIARYWVELAFALARAAREEQDEGGFRRWMDRLGNLRGRRDDWRAQWFHEECQFHLSRLDQAGVRATLEGWPEARGLPMWEVRRAAALAEMEDMEEAERVTQRALETARSRMRPYDADRALMSQEAHALALLEGIEGSDFGADMSLISAYRDRLRELEGYGCNPMAEVRRLEGTVAGAPPALRGWRQETVPSFDPGRRTINTSMPGGLGIGPVLPAFALLRMAEDGALPPRVGRLNRFPEVLLTATRWIEPHAPLWAFSAMSRQAKAKEVRLLWDRAYVAGLPETTVERLYSLLLGAVVQSAERLSSDPGGERPQGSGFAGRQVRLGSELLSRLSVRCSAAQREELFGLAKRMYELPVFRGHNLLHDCPKALFARLLDRGLSREQMLSLMPELLALPIHGEGGFEASLPQTWIEPFMLARWRDDRPLEAHADRSTWEAPIDILVRVVRAGIPEARGRAAVRLAFLLDIGGLTARQEEGFGGALWSRVDERTGLPAGTPFLPQAFLTLPGPEPGRAKGVLRRRVLRLDFEKSVGNQKAADGTGGTVITSSPGEEPLVSLLLGATAAPPLENLEDDANLIDWSVEEASGFLRKMVDLWDEEKRVLGPRLSESPVGALDGVGDRVEGRLRVLSEVVLPRIAQGPGDDKATAQRFIAEVQKAGAPSSFALPALLYADPGVLDEVARKVSTDLASGDRARVRAAAHGVFLWIDHAQRGGIPRPPDRLLDRLVNRSLFRNPAALDSVLSGLRDLLRYHPWAFNNRQLDAVGVSLENLLEDTRLPDHGSAHGGERSAPLPVAWRPDYRWLAAQVAYRLHRTYAQRDGVAPPEVLRRWEQACREDPLPEVRMAWEA